MNHVLYLPVAILFSLVIITTAIVAMSWLIRNRRRQNIAQALIWIHALRSMLIHIQRHRGLSCSVISGHMQMQSRLEDVKQQVGRDLTHMVKVAEHIIEDPEWQAITTHWARLSGRNLQLDVLKNLDQHNRLIKSILVFIDELAVRSFGRLQGKAMDWRYLLKVAEELGQVRAFGLAYLASLKSDQPSVLLRNLLVKQIKELVILLSSDRQRVLSSHSSSKVLGFIDDYARPLVNNPELYDAENYYTSATKVMDHLYVQFDASLQSLLKDFKVTL